MSLKNVGKFLGKHLCRSLFVNEAVGWACSFIKTQQGYRCFLKKFAKFFITLVNGCLKFCHEMDFGKKKKKRYKIKPFKRKPHIMEKNTQKIRQLLPTNCLRVVDHFVGVGT